MLFFSQRKEYPGECREVELAFAKVTSSFAGSVLGASRSLSDFASELDLSLDTKFAGY